MDAAANEMFGPSAARAINHIQNIKRLSAAQHKALGEAQKRAGEFKTERQLAAEQNTKLMTDTWRETNKVLEEKFPKAFKIEEGNADDATSHLKGFALADLMFVGAKGLSPEQVEALPATFRDTVKAGKVLSQKQIVQLHALARLKMANHDRKIVALKKATTRIAELEKALGEYEKSEPDTTKAGEGGTVPSKPWDQVIEDEIRAMDK
jgi:hypothetical protein